MVRFAVGGNEKGQCNVESWQDIVAVCAGSYHTVGLKADGTVVAVGGNDVHRCNTENWCDIVAIYCGDYIVGLKSDGTVVATGCDKKIERDLKCWHGIGPVDIEKQKLQMQKEEEQRRQWAAAGKCQYCGGKLGGIFIKICKVCKAKS
jgi:alpha-tubulin suppressor-like RCC1 family protein